MRNPPSAVNIQRLPQAYVPDNTRAFQTLANFAVQASAQHAKIKQNKADIETAGNLLGKYNVSAKTGAVLEEQAAQVEAARQKAIDEVYSMGDEQIGMAESAIKNANAIAEKNLANIKSNGIMASLLENPDDFKSLMTLQQSNPALAEGVVGIIRKGDERMTAELAKEVTDTVNFVDTYNSIGDAAEQESFLNSYINQRKENGQNVDRLEEARNANPDQRGAIFANMGHLARVTSGLSPIVDSVAAQRLAFDKEKFAWEKEQVSKGGGSGGMASAKTEIMGDGTTIQALPDGTVQVRNPAGKIVSGQARLDALKASNEFEITQQEEGARIAVDKAKSIGKAERAAAATDLGITAAQAQPGLLRAVDLLGEIETGGYDAAALKAKQKFGVESANEAELAYNLGSAVIAQYREKFGSAFTVRETDKLDALSAGLTKSTLGNIRIIENVIKMNKQKIEQGRRGAKLNEDAFALEQIDGFLSVDFTPETEQVDDDGLVNKWLNQ